MKFRYLGDNKIMMAFGYDFSDGSTPDIADGHVISKLISNSHFEPVEIITPLQEQKKRGRKPRDKK